MAGLTLGLSRYSGLVHCAGQSCTLLLFTWAFFIVSESFGLVGFVV